MAPGFLIDHPVVLQETHAPKSSKVQDTTSLLCESLLWSGEELRKRDSYAYKLSAGEVAEVEAALEHFTSLELDGHEVSKGTFPLPTLQYGLQDQAKDLHNGKGFLILQGLDPSARSIEENIIIFLGISSYVAEQRGKQDHKGNMLMHLRNAKLMKCLQEDRPARDSNLRLQFHADLWADVLAMQVLSNAAVGGDHVIAPAYTIYQELQATRPDLLELLMSPVWLFDKQSLHFTPEKRPLIFSHEGRILFNFGRLHVFGDDDLMLPDLTVGQVEALELMQSLAQKHQLPLRQAPGDLIFINNFAMLHSREGFKDTEVQSRHLVRAWLKNEELAWKLPGYLKRGNDLVFYDASVEPNWEIFPQPRMNFEIRDKFSP